jgi:hypothetical protein
MLSRRVPRTSEPNAWARLLEQRRESGARLLDLSEANPTRVGLSGAGEAELAALADPAGARYEPDPRGSRVAREAVSGYYAARGITVPPEQVVLTAGTSEAYAHLFRLLCDPGDEVLAPRPGYPLFEPLAALEGVGLGAYGLAYDGRWHLDRDSLERAIGTRTRLTIAVEPNHPTGTCLSAEDRAFVATLCGRHGLALVSDEVFGDFPWPDIGTCEARPPGPRARTTLPSLLDGAVVPTFVLSGLSKVCGMPQMKLSWIAVAGPERERDRAIAGLEWIADLFLSVSTPVQAALPRLLAARHAFQARVRERIAGNLALLARSLEACPELDLLRAEGGWVATLRLPRRRSEEEWVLGLLRRDVVVHPGHFYDFADEAYVVVSLIVEPRVFAEGLARMESLIAEI